MAEVAWLTGVLDVGSERAEAGLEFWMAASGATLSRCWRVQRLDAGGAALHLDLHASDRQALVGAVTAAGARLVDELDDVTVLTSPGGLPFCVVDRPFEMVPEEPRNEASRRMVPEEPRNEASRRMVAAQPPQGPVDWGGHHSMLDQVCLDVPAASLDHEIAFWSRVLAAEPSRSTRRPEFTNLRRPAHLPLRLLFQRVGHSGDVTAHPDLASTDREAEVTRLAALGAEVVEIEEFWTVLRAPDGRLFCVTERDPHTGQLN